MTKCARFLVLTLCVGLVLAGCKDDDDPIPGTESLVEITPGGSGMPAGTVYYFYAKDATAPSKYDATSNGTFSTEMAFGEYAMLAANTNAAGVNFDGMDVFSSATVSAKAIVPTRMSSTYLEEVSDIYSISVASLTVKEGETTKLTPTPLLITQTISVQFDLDDAIVENIASISADMNGIYSALSLVTGEPTNDAVTNCGSTLVSFNVSSGNLSRATGSAAGTVTILGIQKPGDDLPDYVPFMTIEVILKDETFYTTSVDLTETLKQGDLSSSEIKLPNVEIGPKGAGISATVGDWETPDASDLDPDNNTDVKI